MSIYLYRDGQSERGGKEMCDLYIRVHKSIDIRRCNRELEKRAKHTHTHTLECRAVVPNDLNAKSSLSLFPALLFFPPSRIAYPSTTLWRNYKQMVMITQSVSRE